MTAARPLGPPVVPLLIHNGSAQPLACHAATRGRWQASVDDLDAVVTRSDLPPGRLTIVVSGHQACIRPGGTKDRIPRIRRDYLTSTEIEPS